MKLFLNSLRLLWRVWFYVFFGISVLIMSPFLLILTTKESYYPALYKLIRIFSKSLLFCMGFRLQVVAEELVDTNKSYLFCANHSSMLDPFVLVSMVKNPIVFVGKAELAKIPVFGFFYKKICILVDRQSTKSRREVYQKAKSRLQNGTSVAIFPEGLVPTEDVILSPFKNGAFSLAIEFQIPIVPAIYYDNKRLFSWEFFKGGPGTLRVKQLPFIDTKNKTRLQMRLIKEQAFTMIYNELLKDDAYMNDTNRTNEIN